MKYRTLSVFLFLFAAANLFSQNAGETLILGTVENLPPYSYYEEGKLTGLDIEVVKILFHHIGRDIKIRPLPWARVLAELKSGDIDGAFSFYYSPGRESYAVYMGPVHFDNLGIMVRKGSEFSYQDITDLYGKSVVKGRGVFISRDFDNGESKGLIKVDEILVSRC